MHGAAVYDAYLTRIAELLRKRNTITRRALGPGNLGERTASLIFDIELKPATVAPAVSASGSLRTIALPARQ